MAGGPGSDGLDDARLAESLRAGDTNALTETYDYYAPGLYEYCHALLRDRGEAAAALHDSLVAAWIHAWRLEEPDRLRAWLYALARNECLRRQQDPERAAGLSGLPEPLDGTEIDLDSEERTRREEQRLIAHSALARLTGRQREAIDLSVRHELDAADLARILSIGQDESTALLGKARGDLGEAIAAALVARTWRDDCPSVVALVETWPLHTEAARKLVRHVASCPVCGNRDTPRVSASRLLDALPVAPLPHELRPEVLTMATEPAWEEHRLIIGRAAEPFDDLGWPVVLSAQNAPQARAGHSRRGPLMLVGLTVAVLVTVVTATAMALSGPGGAPAAKGPADNGTPSSSAPAQTSPGDPTTAPVPTTSSGSPSPSKTPQPSLSEGGGANSPSRGPSASASSRNEPAPQGPPAPGRLAVTGCSMGRGEGSCSVTVRALGGPVSWRVTDTSGKIRAHGGGSLNAGESRSVQVDRTGKWCLGTDEGSVSFSPGGSASVSWIC